MKKASRQERKVKAATVSGGAAASPAGVNTESTRFWFLTIFTVAFILRLFYLFQIDTIPLFEHLAGDARTYYEWGRRIAAGEWLGAGVFYQAPLYPYFLGILQFFFGETLWLVRLIQITLGALSCSLIFLIGQQLFSRQAGMISGFILASYGPALFFDGLIEKSILDLFLLTVILFLIFSAGGEANRAKWLGIGAVLGLLALSRENALILVPVVPCWIALSSAPVLRTTRLRRIGLFFAGLTLVLLPVGLRNLSVGGEFKLTTSQLGPNFFIGNNPAADGTYNSVRDIIGEPQLEGPDARRLAERALQRSVSPGEVSSYWLGKSFEYIKTQPWDWLRLLAKKWMLLWNAREIEDSDDFYIYRQWSSLLGVLGRLNHFGLLAPLAAVGLLVSLREWRRLWLLYLMLLALAASVAVFYVFGRYRFPLVPFLVLFAGAGSVQIVSFYKHRRWNPLFGALAVFCACAIFTNWPLLEYSRPGAAGYNNLSNAYYKQGRVEEAIQTALKAIEVEPNYGIAHYNIGNIYAGQGQFALAQRHFEEALRIYPNYAEVHSNLGQLLSERDNLHAGIEHFRRAIALDPALFRAHLNLGVALAKHGQIDEADGPLREAARLNPQSAETRFYLGSVYAAQNRFDLAAESFKEALKIEANFAAAHESLARVLSAQGKRQEAMAHYQEAIRLISGRRAAPKAP
ncbi:MAG TPA: tetratricopeptide repeat protein [Candidatus Binatia bacterium]|nr:tetratricopeptide repeat protein [Candidatus Binatia bacterium]